MNTSDDDSVVPVAEPGSGRTPTAFAGTIDKTVMRDIHRLVPRSAKLGLSIMRIMGIGSLLLGTPIAILARGYPELLFPSIAFLAMGFFFLFGWWVERKGRARFGLDQVITGRIYGSGIVVDQLVGRTDWEVFQRAYISSSAILLFVHRKNSVGLPLHRSFFESAGAWEDVIQLIRERVRNVGLVEVPFDES